MRILVDLDNVLVDLNTIWVNTLNEMYGFSVDPDSIVAWDMQQFFPGLSRTQIFKPFSDVNTWKNIEIIDESDKYLMKLINEGNEVYICTSTFYPYIEMKFEKIIRKRFPFISWGNVIITSKKQLIDADVLIDDAVHNLVGGSYSKLLFTSPHNRSVDAESLGLVRVNNWRESYNSVKRLSWE